MFVNEYAFAPLCVTRAVEAVNASTSKFQAAVARAEAGGLMPGEAVFRAAEQLGASTRPMYTQLLLPVAQLEDGERHGVGTSPPPCPLDVSSKAIVSGHTPPHFRLMPIHAPSAFTPFPHLSHTTHLPAPDSQESASWSGCGATSCL